jgi:hypothetical protein
MAAFATDGTFAFRFGSGVILSFDYKADLKAGKLTGELDRQGVNQVNLTASREGGWSGMLGGAGVSMNPISTSEGGRQQLTIQTIEGIYTYTIDSDGKGNFEFATIGKNGDLLHASLTDKGSLSVDSTVMSFELDRDSKHPDQFSGNAVIDFWDMDTDTVDLTADGTLDPNALAKQDPALFTLLYVLPFHLGN